MLFIFVNFLLTNDNYCYIHLDYEITLITIQKYLCKHLENCYIYDNLIYNNNNNNYVFQIYNKCIYGIMKQTKNTYYIWKIKY